MCMHMDVIMYKMFNPFDQTNQAKESIGLQVGLHQMAHHGDLSLLVDPWGHGFQHLQSQLD